MCWMPLEILPCGSRSMFFSPSHTEEAVDALQSQYLPPQSEDRVTRRILSALLCGLGEVFVLYHGAKHLPLSPSN